MVKQFDVSIPAAAGKIHISAVVSYNIKETVSIPAAAGKIHRIINRLMIGQIPFQFPQLRVRYIAPPAPQGESSMFQFPQLRVRYMTSERLFMPSH